MALSIPLMRRHIYGKLLCKIWNQIRTPTLCFCTFVKGFVIILQPPDQMRPISEAAAGAPDSDSDLHPSVTWKRDRIPPRCLGGITWLMVPFTTPSFTRLLMRLMWNICLLSHFQTGKLIFSNLYMFKIIIFRHFTVFDQHFFLKRRNLVQKSPFCQ